MDKKLLNKFISNQCTSNEINGFFDWLEEHCADKLKEEFLFRSYWDDIKITDNPDDEFAQRRLDRIHHTINLNQSKQIEDTKIRFFPRKTARLIKLISRVAAILLIPVLTLLVYTHFFQSELYSLLNVSQKYEIVSPPGSRIQFELSDGTKVWLNHGSKMVYPQRFIGDTRTVHLIGEGYFDVAPDKTKPFIVEAQGMTVKAVGTSFNIKAYADDIDFETTLESGKVIVLRNTNGSQSEVCQMQPGEHFVFNETTNKYSLQTENPSKYVSWKDGKLVFKDDHLNKVAERLSHWYNVNVSLKDPELRSLTYTATFIDETLDQVLEMMEVVTPISYTVSERQKMADGTYSPKEVLIYKKGGKVN